MNRWIMGIVASLAASGIVALVMLAISHAKLEQRVEQLQAETERDESQDSQIRKHWRYLSWTRQHINKLYQMSGSPIPDEPNIAD